MNPRQLQLKAWRARGAAADPPPVEADPRLARHGSTSRPFVKAAPAR